MSSFQVVDGASMFSTVPTTSSVKTTTDTTTVALDALETVDQIVKKGWSEIAQLPKLSRDWSMKGLDYARKIKALGGHKEAVDFYLVAIVLIRDFNVLQEAVDKIDDQAIKFKVLKYGATWPYAGNQPNATEWTKWIYWDELSVIAYYQMEK